MGGFILNGFSAQEINPERRAEVHENLKGDTAEIAACAQAQQTCEESLSPFEAEKLENLSAPEVKAAIANLEITQPANSEKAKIAAELFEQMQAAKQKSPVPSTAASKIEKVKSIQFEILKKIERPGRAPVYVLQRENMVIFTSKPLEVMEQFALTLAEELE